MRLTNFRARLRAIAHHPTALRVAHNAEGFGNVALVTATGIHEWGNLVGFACGPVLAILMVNLLLNLTNAGGNS